MNHIGVFEEELNLIHDEELRNFTREYLEEYVPSYFYTCGASSSGKYHPKFSQGEGGLVRHTKAVVKFAVELMKLDIINIKEEKYQDAVIISCLVHDTAKYGLDNEMNKKEYSRHAKNACDNFEDFYLKKTSLLPKDGISEAIVSHMGQWEENEEYANIIHSVAPWGYVARTVHLADYLASRNFIDIPELNTIDT